MRREDIEFDSEGTTVRGWLYRPDGAGKARAVVLAGGWCYVRELVMPYYAEAFATAGIAALIIDYRNLGSSDGEPVSTSTRGRRSATTRTRSASSSAPTASTPIASAPGASPTPAGTC